MQARAIDEGRELGRCRDAWRLGEAGRGVAPRAVQQAVDEEQRHGVEEQGGDDLVDPESHTQERGHQRPRRAGDGAAGLSPNGARFAGISVSRTLLGAALVSGAIAGIAGVSEVAGIQNRLTGGLSPGYGYTGIVVATLGTLTMPGVAVAALFLGDLTVGASSAARSLGIPSQLGAVVQGVLLLTTVALLALRRHRSRRSEGSDAGPVTGGVAPEAQPG